MSRVEVMVPCYNYARYLDQCVDSVLAQSHRDLRVVIFDDASTDDTAQVCAALAAKDPRVEVVRHPVNIGHIATYNESIGLASADYMLILSADDFLLPGALARAVSVLDRQPDIGLAPGHFVAYRAGDPIPDTAGEEANAMLLDQVQLVETLAISNFIGTATAVVRTSVQQRLGGYRADLPHSGDLEMWLRFALHSKVAYLRTYQAAFRRHDSNMSRGYGRAADFRQRLAAFAPHYETIRQSLPDGETVLAEVRKTFAANQPLMVRGHRGGTGQEA